MKIDNETYLLLNAYHDGELSPGEALAMERRIAKEPELAALAGGLADLSSRLTDILPGKPAPERLRATIAATLSLEPAEGWDLKDGHVEPERQQASAETRFHWRSMAAALLIGVFGGGLGGAYLTRQSFQELQKSNVEHEIVAAHLRGLIAPQPFDIASSEGHVVKPWFNGRTTIAPDTPNFTAEGFPLVGGRVDVIGRKPVPVIVYKRRQHTISVSVTSSMARTVSGQEAIEGTNLESWSYGGLTYWAASDLNPRELSIFAGMYKQRLAGAR